MDAALRMLLVRLSPSWYEKKNQIKSETADYQELTFVSIFTHFLQIPFCYFLSEVRLNLHEIFRISKKMYKKMVILCAGILFKFPYKLRRSDHKHVIWISLDQSSKFTRFFFIYRKSFHGKFDLILMRIDKRWTSIRLKI